MITVLIVDDESIERSYLNSVFRKREKRYRILAEAENGEKAVELAALYRPDIIIMDISMPLLNGLDAAALIRRNVPERIIILNSAYTEFEFARRAVELNLDAYLLKPAQEDEIFSSVENCLRRRRIATEYYLNTYRESELLHYPYEIVDRLLEAVVSSSSRQLKAEIKRYLAFLRDSASTLQGCRMHIANTLFSLERVLHKRENVSKDSLLLLDATRFQERIAHAVSDHDILSLLEDFFARLQLLQEQSETAPPDPVGVVANFIDSNYPDPITLELLASLVGLSPSYLSRLFHERKGFTVRGYLNRCRIDRAVYLLRNTDRKIRDIACDCGFNNLSHFHRVFGEQTKSTPARTREAWLRA